MPERLCSASFIAVYNTFNRRVCRNSSLNGIQLNAQNHALTVLSHQARSLGDFVCVARGFAAHLKTEEEKKM